MAEDRSPSRVLFTYDVDAVEVVRCKDCAYWDEEDLYCIDFWTIDPEGFCSWAKRREKKC